MRLIDADKLYPDCITKDGKLAISQSQLANAPTIEINTNDIEYKAYCKGLEDGKKIARSVDEEIETYKNAYRIMSDAYEYEVTKNERPQGEWISKEEALKIMCEKCPVYNCVSGCNSYRSIEKMSSVQLQIPKGGAE